MEQGIWCYPYPQDVIFHWERVDTFMFIELPSETPEFGVDLEDLTY